MAYRLNGTDPFLRASPGTLVGYDIGRQPSSCFALLKRNALSSWQGIWTMDTGGTSVWHDLLEFTPGDKLTSYAGGGTAPASTAGFADTTNWMIVGYTWDGTATAGHLTWWWKIGAGAWSSETATLPQGSVTAIGSGFRQVIGNEPALGDDANFDVVCVGAIKSQLASGTLQTLTMTDIASWDAVFTGSTAWLLGFDAIGTRTDRTGNGGNELSRSAGITLVSDPSGWSWGASTTPVSQTFSAPYDAPQALVDVNSGAWEAQQPLAAMQSMVVEATQAVSVTASGSFEVAGQVQGTVSSPYDAQQQAQATASAAWEAVTALATARSAPWDTVLAVAAATSGPYEALLRAALTVSAPWEASGSAVTPVSQTFSAPWETTAGVATAWSAAWEAAAALAATLGLPFETVAPLAAILSSGYEAQSAVSASASAAWEALTPLLAAASLPYEARGFVAATLSLPWESRSTGRPARPDGPPGTGRIAVLLPGRIDFSGQGRIDHGTPGGVA